MPASVAAEAMQTANHGSAKGALAQEVALQVPSLTEGQVLAAVELVAAVGLAEGVG